MSRLDVGLVSIATLDDPIVTRQLSSTSRQACE